MNNREREMVEHDQRTMRTQLWVTIGEAVLMMVVSCLLAWIGVRRWGPDMGVLLFCAFWLGVIHRRRINQKKGRNL